MQEGECACRRETGPPQSSRGIKNLTKKFYPAQSVSSISFTRFVYNNQYIYIYICIDRYVEENRTIFDTRRYHEERVKRET